MINVEVVDGATGQELAQMQFESAPFTVAFPGYIDRTYTAMPEKACALVHLTPITLPVFSAEWALLEIDTYRRHVLNRLCADGGKEAKTGLSVISRMAEQFIQEVIALRGENQRLRAEVEELAAAGEPTVTLLSVEGGGA